MSITVNGIEIDEHSVGLEAQYHPAASWDAAVHEARRALVVRELLLQEAARQGLYTPRMEHDEREEQQALGALIDREVSVPLVPLETCRAYYARYAERFKSPDLFEASHILFAVRPGDEEGRVQARALAEQTLCELRDRPERFAKLARERSGCPSAENGGSLGQLSRGETLPAFEAALELLMPGELGPELVETTHGFHIMRLDHRARGEQAPFEAVRARIEIYLRDASWRRKLRAYISELAQRAEITGFDLDAPAPTQAPAPQGVRSRVRLQVVA